jgi:DNA processing protein
LINQGAKLVGNINDIVEELPEVSLSDILPQKKDDSIKGMDKTGSKVLKCLSYEPLSIDQLVEKTNLSPQIVSQELLLLELAGKLEKTHAQGYILIK